MSSGQTNLNDSHFPRAEVTGAPGLQWRRARLVKTLLQERRGQDVGPAGNSSLLRLAGRATAVWAVMVQATMLWLYWVPAPKTLWGDEVTYLAAAQRLLATGSAGLDTLWPPLAPHFLAGVLSVSFGSLFPLHVLQLGLLLVAALLLRDLAARICGSRLAGTVAALLLLADPTMAAFATYLWPEVLHAFLFLAVLWVLVLRPDRPAWLAIGGTALGLALLTKSLLGPFVPILLLPFFLSRPRGRSLARAALLVGVAAAIVAPVIISNGLSRDAFVVSDSSRFNLWVGLNDSSPKSMVNDIAGREYQAYLESAPDFRGRQAVLAGKISAYVRQRGVLAILREQLGRQYFRLFDRDSYLDDQLPGGPSHASGAGYPSPAPWLARTVHAYSHAHYAMVLVATAFGVVAFRSRPHPWMRVILAFLAYNLGVFLLLHVKSRYRLQFVPFLELLAGVGLAGLWAQVKGVAAPIGPWRIAAATGLALLLLLLAFGGTLLPE